MLPTLPSFGEKKHKNNQKLLYFSEEEYFKNYFEYFLKFDFRGCNCNIAPFFNNLAAEIVKI